MYVNGESLAGTTVVTVGTNGVQSGKSNCVLNVNLKKEQKVLHVLITKLDILAITAITH
jgi:hypothetical protein